MSGSKRARVEGMNGVGTETEGEGLLEELRIRIAIN
jgi:hypothetical protein